MSSSYNINILQRNILPNGSFFGEYLYWNTNTNSWEIGSTTINLGKNTGNKPKENTIILNATGDTLNAEDTNRFYVKPIRNIDNVSGISIMTYNELTGEVTYTDISNIDIIDISGNLNMNCKYILDVSDITFCNGTSYISTISDISNNILELSNNILDLSNNKYDKTGGLISGDVDINGNVDVTGNMIIDGSLLVQGTTTTLNTQNLVVKDNIITINQTLSGEEIVYNMLINPDDFQSGIQVYRGPETMSGPVREPYLIIYDESSNTFRVGISGELQPVATREDNPIPNGIAIWDNSNNRFITTLGPTIDISGNLNMSCNIINDVSNIIFCENIHLLTTNDNSKNPIKIGYNAGLSNQGLNAISLGYLAGQNNQNNEAIAIGNESGKSTQGNRAISIGYLAGEENQESESVALGVGAGRFNLGFRSVGIGYSAGYNGISGDYTIALGYEAGQSQYNNTIAIGRQASKFNQGISAISIGTIAGFRNQGNSAIAIGNNSGVANQSISSISIGNFAARNTQGEYSIAIGNGAGREDQGNYSLSIGNQAGYLNQGNNSIAIGNKAGQTNQHENSIVLNATGNTLNSDVSNALYIKPIRSEINLKGKKLMFYDDFTGEIIYTNNGSIDLSCGNITDVSDISFCNGTSYISTISRIDVSLNDHESRIEHNELNIIELSNNKYDKTGGLISGDVEISGNLYMSCNLINDVSGINFCDGTYIGEGSSFDISANNVLLLSGIQDPSGNYNGASIVTKDRIYQELNPDISWNAVNGYLGLAKDAYPALNPYSSGDKAVSTWTLRIPASDNDWRSVCWAAELGLLVAVSSSGSNNRVMTSPDGINWTSQSNPVDNNWRSICWAPELGLLVAVSDNGINNRVMTSPDGINWTIQTTPINSWISVCWAPELGLLVAVSYSGINNRVMTSPDGINWTIQTTPVDNNWRSICWAPELGLLVAVSITGINNRVMTSPDGINWTTQISAANNDWISVCWAPELGILVAVSYTGIGNRIMTSPDGINWTIQNNPIDINWVSICWAPELGLLVAVSTTGTNNRVMTSPDGINWTIQNSPDYSWSSLCWAPELGLLVAISTSANNRVMTSSLKGRPPTSYNVFDNNFNNIDNSGNWTIKAKEIYGEDNILLNGNVDISGTLNIINGSLDMSCNPIENVSRIIFCENITLTSEIDNSQNKIKIGYNSGIIQQGTNAIAIGLEAGQSTQGTNAIAIGYGAGRNTQGDSSIAIGLEAGRSTQGNECVAIGYYAGRILQGQRSIAIGYTAGQSTQGQYSVAISFSAGRILQGQYAIAVGFQAGQNTQGQDAISIGNSAGQNIQGESSISIGRFTGRNSQGDNTIAIGAGNDVSGSAGGWYQQTGAIALGYNAGQYTQGTNAVAIGVEAGQNNQGIDTVAIGYIAGEINQSQNSVAIGRSAGQFTQNINSIAIGVSAGGINQGPSSIAIGTQAGQYTQGEFAITIGSLAGQTNQADNAIAIGRNTARNNQGEYAVAISFSAGQVNQGRNSIAIGRNAARNLQGENAISIGSGIDSSGGAGGWYQQTGAIALGYNAGQYTQGTNAVAIGVGAGQITQGPSAVALGSEAGKNTQGPNAVAIGVLAGQYTQGPNAIAVGNQAGRTNQGLAAVAIGRLAGENNQSQNALAFGNEAGQNIQGPNAIAVGNQAGKTNQGINAVAVGNAAGQNIQGQNAVAMGYLVGLNNQGQNTIAIGAGTDASGSAGGWNQQTGAIALGYNAGQYTQGTNAVAIGTETGQNNQSLNAVAIGYQAGLISQGTNAIAIGVGAGQTNQHTNSIVLNATGTTLNTTTSSAMYAAPIRSETDLQGKKIMYYNTSSGEITYTEDGSIDLSCGIINDVSGIYFCDGTYIGHGSSFDISTNEVLKINQDKIVVDTNGNVGIGTKDPSNNFHIYSNTGLPFRAQAKQGGGSDLAGEFIGHNAGYIDIMRANKTSKIRLGVSSTNQGFLQSTVSNFFIQNNTGDSILTSDGTNKRIGINDTSPSHSLDVYNPNTGEAIIANFKSNATTNLSAITFENNGYTSTIPPAISGLNNNIILYTGISGETIQRRLTVTDNGNVGIGTSNPRWKLETIVDSSTLGNGLIRYGGGGPSYFIGASANGSESAPVDDTQYGGTFLTQGYRSGFKNLGQINIHGEGNASSGGGIKGKIEFVTYDDNSSYQERMRITSNGNVGIGTTNPQEKLDVSGNIKLQKTSSGNSKGSYDLLLYGTTSTGIDTPQAKINSTVYPNNTNAGNLNFYTENTVNNFIKRMDIDGAGNIAFYEDTGINKGFVWDAINESIGIGTTTPDTSLHIQIDNDTNAIPLKLSNINTTGSFGNNVGIQFENTGTTSNFPPAIGSNNNDLVFFTGLNSENTSEKMRIDQSGNFTFNQNNTLSFKDISSTFQNVELPTIHKQPVSLQRLSVFRNTNSFNISDGTSELIYFNETIVNQLNLNITGINNELISPSIDISGQMVEIYINMLVNPNNNSSILRFDISSVAGTSFIEEIGSIEFRARNEDFYVTLGPHMFIPDEWNTSQQFVFKLTAEGGSIDVLIQKIIFKSYFV